MSINEQKGSEEQMSRYAEHLAQSTDVLRQAPQLWRNHTDPPASNSVVQLFVTPWTVVHQAPLSMGFSRQEYWIELPFPSLGDLPDSGVSVSSPAWQVDFLPI